MLKNLFKNQQICAHTKITPDMEAGYCADCGEYIENHWYITRCKCCGIKQKTVIIKNSIMASTKFCKNCGSNIFIVQKLDRIGFVDINYAVVLKQIIKDKRAFFVQSWVEPTENVRMKLLSNPKAKQN